ncbi:putative membrane protein [Rhodopirellula maiorica SM1]|uniref:Putative membrane protein n=1 Tax=Rhodopirellula maiorica SM1 TaxID=1265738 RepID=M5RP56_9BACT|nr:DUF1269 domain-containing protein [Rhodopirellula maiorica]EMI15744.1 putative membrane protein [Rhodopirellula maiorica SM1]
MNAECLVAVYDSLSKAEVGVEVLEKFDFAPDAVSLVWRGHEEALENLDWERGAKIAKDVAASMGLGAVLSSAVALPLSIATLMVPVVVTGPLVALVGGATVGGLLGETRHWGIHHHSAKNYEQMIADGSVLVIVTSTPARIEEALQGLKTTHPQHLERFAFQRALKSPPTATS